MRWAGYCRGATAHVSGSRQATEGKQGVGEGMWQLLGEAVIDGGALGSLSIWTWLTRSRTEHLSLTAMQEEWDAHREQRQRFYLDRHLGNVLQRRSDYLFAAIFKGHHQRLSPKSKRCRGRLQPFLESFVKPRESEQRGEEEARS